VGYQKKRIDPLSSEKYSLGHLDLTYSQKWLKTEKRPQMAVLTKYICCFRVKWSIYSSNKAQSFG